MSLKSKILAANETLVEIVVGIIPVTIVAGVVGAVLIGAVDALADVNISIYLYSLVLGALCAVLMVMHMYRTLDRGLDMINPDDAAKYSKRGYGLRLIFMVLVLLCSLKFSFLNFAGVFIGFLTLKVSIYTRVLTRKMLNKIFARADTQNIK